MGRQRVELHQFLGVSGYFYKGQKVLEDSSSDVTELMGEITNRYKCDEDILRE